MPKGVRGRLKRKACIKCKAVVPYDTKVCPVCGSTEFSEDFVGLVVIVDTEKSLIAKKLGIKKPFTYALKVR